MPPFLPARRELEPPLSVRLTSKKYYSDTAWNLGSFAVQAAAGAALTLGLMHLAGPDTLGIFNQLYAVFVITGQVAAFGLQDSAQKFIAQYLGVDRKRGAIGAAGLLCAGLSGALSAALLAAASPLIGRLTASPQVAHGVLLLSPGILFFALNKVLFGILNGEQRMRLYAAANAVRALLVVSGCVAVVLLKMPLARFGAAFSLTEVLLILLLLPQLSSYLAWRRDAAAVKLWVRRHLAFGAKSLPHGLLMETFLRIDILVLAVFMPDHDVGIYSFVAFFIEGIFQIPHLVRTVTNPMLVKIVLGRDRQALHSCAARSSGTSAALTAFVSFCLLLIYPVLAGHFPMMDAPMSYSLLKVLLGGLVAYSVFVPIDNILLQGGRPGLQSVYRILATAVNIILNITLIPRYGLIGAAFATACSFAVSGPLLCLMAYRSLDIGSWSVRRHR